MHASVQMLKAMARMAHLRSQIREKLDHRVQIHYYVCQKSKMLNKITETNNLIVNITLCKQMRKRRNEGKRRGGKATTVLRNSETPRNVDNGLN